VSDCQEKRHSNPIANRVRRERQRLPTCLLIENALGPARLPGNFCAEAFPIKASDHPEAYAPLDFCTAKCRFDLELTNVIGLRVWGGALLFSQ